MTKPKQKSPTVLVALPGLSLSQKKSIGATKYDGPRVRGENEAGPITFNTFGQPWTYGSMQSNRPGCDDHAQIRSIGTGC